MKWVKNSSLISALLFVAHYISRWFLIPNLLPHPPAIAGPVGRYMWLHSLTKEMQQKITYTVYLTTIIMIIALVFYILNLILRIKYRKWDKWFIILSLLVLPSIPTIIMLAISLSYFLPK